MAKIGSSNDEPCCFIVANDVESPPTSQELVQIFMKGTIDEKISGLKTLIKLIISDDGFPRLIMQVLQFLVPSDDHGIKKLLLLYWEVVDKLKADGSVKDELILACNNLRKDLLHANEFIRGKTLKLVSKLTYRSILEPLMQSILENLEHRHCYVRRNAIACLFTIFLSCGSDILGSVIDKIEDILETETDLSTKRNAFLLLFHCNQEKAFVYLNSILENEDSLSDIGDLMQLLIIELIRKSCVAEPSEKPKYMGTVYVFAQSKSTAVLLECANTLITLSKSPNAIKLAIQCYMKLLSAQHENNVILSILSNIEELLKTKKSEVLDENMLDILNIMSNSSLGIREKAFKIVMDLCNERNLAHVLEYIKKNLRKDKGSPEYANFWIKAVNQLSALNPQRILKELTIPLIEEYLTLEPTKSDKSGQDQKGEEDSEKKNNPVEEGVAYEVAKFTQKALMQAPELQSEIIERIILLIPEIKVHSVLISVIWIVGEYAKSEETVIKTLNILKDLIGSLPIIPIIKGNVSKEEQKKEETVVKKKKKQKLLFYLTGHMQRK